MYVCGISKTYYNKESKKHNKRARKRYFCYQYSLESVNYKTGKPGIVKKRISFFQAIYYKITFLFGFKAKLRNCEHCKRYYIVIPKFYDRSIECPNC